MYVSYLDSLALLVGFQNVFAVLSSGDIFFTILTGEEGLNPRELLLDSLEGERKLSYPISLLYP